MYKKGKETKFIESSKKCCHNKSRKFSIYLNVWFSKTKKKPNLPIDYVCPKLIRKL